MSDLTASDVAAEFGCSTEYVQQQCRKNRWPFYRVARTYFFTAEDVEQIKAISRPKQRAEAPADSWGQKTRAAS